MSELEDAIAAALDAHDRWVAALPPERQRVLEAWRQEVTNRLLYGECLLCGRARTSASSTCVCLN